MYVGECCRKPVRKMGLPLNLVPILDEMTRLNGLRGSVCTLGVQDVPFAFEDLERALNILSEQRGPITALNVFSALGFSSVEALDFSNHEGAEHIFDLNSSALPSVLHNRYDLVYNGGTLEHVFHLPNALRSVSKMLRAGGTVMHLLPCNNWVEHGFYQISPTLMFDYYAAARYLTLGSFFCRYQNENSATWRIEPAIPGALASGAAGSLNADVCLLVFAARRGDTIDEAACPIQRLYADKPVDLAELQRLWFRPFVIEHGTRIALPPFAQMDLSGKITPDKGACWRVDMPEMENLADCMNHPSRSQLVVLENDLPLGPQHSLHETIRSVGRGCFSHWGGSLHFSSSDNSDPRSNGRTYTVLIPG
jgi:hypothetical protein